jgi:hypothetical protein
LPSCLSNRSRVVIGVCLPRLRGRTSVWRPVSGLIARR